MENESPMPERPAGPVYGELWHPEERNWSMLVHFSALTSIATSGVGGILGPLIVWLIFRGKSDMVNVHGKRALNFQISFLIYFLILFIAMIPFIIIGTIAGEKEEIVTGFWAGAHSAHHCRATDAGVEHRLVDMDYCRGGAGEPG